MRGSRFRFGSFELDSTANELRKNGLRIHIEDQPSRVLSMLVSRPGDVVTREELKDALWADDTHVDFDRSLTRAVNKVRVAINDSASNPRYVETLPKRGYRFVAPVTRLDEPSETVSPSAPAETAAASPDRTVKPRGPAAAGVEQLAERRNYLRPPALWSVGGIAVVLALGAGTWRTQREALAKTASAELAYQRGMALLQERTLPKVKQGADELRHAVQDNPSHARAWAGLAKSAILLDPIGSDAAIEYARRAVGLDPECGECHGILGLLLFSTKWRWDEAGVHLAKAAALSPQDPRIQISLAQREAALGRITHAVEILDRAAKQFPNNLNIGAVRAQVLYYGRDYDGAIRESDRLSAINLSGGLEWKSNALFQMARNAEAIYALHGFLGSWSSASPETIANRKNSAVTRFVKAGLPGALGDLLKLTEPAPAARVHSHNRARWLMLLGKRELAIKELQVALLSGLGDVIYLKVEPVFDPIRSDPEFLRILNAIGLDR